MLIWYKIPHYQCGFCAVSEKWYFLVYDAVFRDFTKSYFISYQHNCIEQNRTYVIFLDIGEILEKGVHESSVCDTGVYRFPNFHIFKQFPFQIPYNLDHFFNSQLHLTIPFCLFNSLILQYLPHVTHFPKSLPLSQTVPTPSVRSSSPTYFTSTFISNSADVLVYPSTLSGEVLCGTLRLVWCVCVRPSLCPPPMVSRYNLRTDFKFCTVVWYHKIQIKFEFQCDQIIGSKVVTVWRLKICETWRGMKIQGKQFLICYTGDELLIKYN